MVSSSAMDYRVEPRWRHGGWPPTPRNSGYRVYRLGVSGDELFWSEVIRAAAGDGRFVVLETSKRGTSRGAQVVSLKFCSHSLLRRGPLSTATLRKAHRRIKT